MKILLKSKVVLFIGIFIMIVGCSLDTASLPVDYMDIWKEVSQIEYIRDPQQWGTREYWETPDEIITSGETDCEGYCIYFLDLLYQQTGYSGKMITIHGSTIFSFHTIVKIGDEYLEPQCYGYYYTDLIDDDILFELTYEETLFLAKYIM